MMKKHLIVACLAAACSAAWAQQGGFSDPAATPATGGFVGPTASMTTVEQARSLRDDTFVVLEGRIEQRLGRDKYLFRDSSGTITVDVDDRRWNGQRVTPQDRVRIEGEVDKDWNSVEIDVKTITKL
ncbi:MAG: YgiW/YdeI family stress tolerance OB fold protein [Rhodocyclaceae bacterium]